MKVWMKYEDWYYCLDDNEKVKEGEIIRNTFLEIQDSRVIGLILNTEVEERRKFFHSSQLAPKLTPGEAIEKFIDEEKEVMYEVSGQLVSGKVKKISKETIRVCRTSSVSLI